MKKLMVFVLLMVLCGNLLVGAADGGEITTLNEAVAAPGVHYYVKQGDQCVEVPAVQHQLFVLAGDIPDGMVTIDRSNQELILVCESGDVSRYVYLYLVSEYSYCCPIIFSDNPVTGSWVVEEWYVNDVEKSMNQVHTYSSNGICTQRVGRVGRTDDCFMLVSDSPSTVELGEYVGTHYWSVEVTCDSLLVKYEWDKTLSYCCYYQKTKDGYFVLDISDLPTGLYHLENGFAIQIIN